MSNAQPAPQPIPAGWYNDGSGQQRWWDGAQWTSHYAPAAARRRWTAGRVVVRLTAVFMTALLAVVLLVWIVSGR